MKILLTRTDRIGDVVLSTPAIKAARDKYPDAYIAFMVRPYARDIVDGNPYLDEVIVYDKYGKHKSLIKTISFALSLKKKKFDLCLMLHPTNRVHLIAHLAGIKRRVGYDRKCAFFLTEKIPHKKQEGKRHESDYTLDLLRAIGAEPKDKELFVPVKANDAKRIDDIFFENHIGDKVPVVAVNPGASCVSKRWASERFAEVCERLAENEKARIIIISDEKNKSLAYRLAESMRHEPVNLAGKTTVGELAALLAKANLFISNDSGPVHVACAVGTPVISIFGRKDAGLSPRRWGPTSKKSITLHKDVGCKICLAHDCPLNFKCLDAITVDEVYAAARTLLTPSNPSLPPISPYGKEKK